MKEKPKKRERLTPEQLADRAEALLKGKELNPNGKELFEQVLKKAANVKQRSAK